MAVGRESLQNTQRCSRGVPHRQGYCNGAEAKPSKELKEGYLLTVKKVPIMRYSYKVVALVERRLPAKDVPQYCLDITPQEELDKLNAPRETIFVMRDRGTGRPTKKERRDLDALWDSFEN